MAAEITPGKMQVAISIPPTTRIFLTLKLPHFAPTERQRRYGVPPIRISALGLPSVFGFRISIFPPPLFSPTIRPPATEPARRENQECLPRSRSRRQGSRQPCRLEG